MGPLHQKVNARYESHGVGKADIEAGSDERKGSGG